MAGKRGLLRREPTRYAPVLEHYLHGALTLSGLPPASGDIDRASEVASWPMYANDEWEDCVWAMIGHSIQAMTAYATGTPVTVPVQSLLDGYSAVTGFNPSAGPPGENPTDNGTVLQDALEYWRTTGIKDADGNVHTITAYAMIRDLTDQQLIGQVLAAFGTIAIGLNLPDSAEEQFDAGEVWAVVPGDQIEGGHGVAYQRRGLRVAGIDEMVTWGKLQRAHVSWWDTYVAEAWAVFSTDYLNAAGRSIQGLDQAQLVADLAYA
jgi:hypothetical protein